MSERVKSIMTLDDYRWAVADYQAALPRAKRMLAERLDSVLAQAIIERTRVLWRLQERWDLLATHPGHERFDEREESWIESLHEYESWSSLTWDICRALGQNGERCR